MCEIPSNPGLAKCVNRIVYSPIELKKHENDRGKAYRRAWQQIESFKDLYSILSKIEMPHGRVLQLKTY